ncbi:MAG: ribonuclease H-like domain-containing protein [Bacillota bacterium]
MDLAARLELLKSRAQERQARPRGLPEGEPTATPVGTAVVSRHSGPPFPEAGAWDPDRLAWLAGGGPGPRGAGPKVIFLDTETTGLAGGTGTYAFLVGILRLVPAGGWEIQQFFMGDPGEEAAMLTLLAEALAGDPVIVTYNGKAFDWPLLETRFILSRMQVPRVSLHLDLLFPARRVWRERLKDCSLSNLHLAVLGGDRTGDVPGWEIPSLYFEYQRLGEAGAIVPVFSHNRADIRALAELALRLCRISRDPLATLEAPEDLAGMGRLLAARGQGGLGRECLEGAVSRGLAGPPRAAAERLLLRIARRQLPEAAYVKLCYRLLDSGDRSSLWPHDALAKHLEHRRRDYAAAEAVTAAALREATAEAQTAFAHRLARLRRKLALQA